MEGDRDSALWSSGIFCSYANIIYGIVCLLQKGNQMPTLENTSFTRSWMYFDREYHWLWLWPFWLILPKAVSFLATPSGAESSCLFPTSSSVSLSLWRAHWQRTWASEVRDLCHSKTCLWPSGPPGTMGVTWRVPGLSLWGAVVAGAPGSGSYLFCSRK